MFKSKILFFLSFVLLAAIGFTGCNEDPCDGVDCGANGVPIEDTVFGTCECDCDAGYELVNGTCQDLTESCPDVECGLGDVDITTDGDCFCVCPDDTVNNGDGLGCVTIVTCDETTCINGDCVDNACACDDNYEGDDCNTASVAKFIGTWSITETCVAEEEVDGVCISYEDTYTFTVTENGTSITNVIINNFLGVDSDGDAYIPALVAEIDGSNITVTTQASDSPFYNYNTSGTGVYSVSEEVETVTYDFTVNEMDSNGISTCVVNCSSIWTKN